MKDVFFVLHKQSYINGKYVKNLLNPSISWFIAKLCHDNSNDNISDFIFTWISKTFNNFVSSFLIKIPSEHVYRL